MSNLAPRIAKQIANGRLSTPLRTGATRNFLRKPYGPGWVLIGDAGHKKDPCTAQGITDAFIDVDMCMPILDAALRDGEDPEESLAAWHGRGRLCHREFRVDPSPISAKPARSAKLKKSRAACERVGLPPVSVYEGTEHSMATDAIRAAYPSAI